MIGSELVDQTLEKLGDDPDAAAGAQFYTPDEVLVALNQVHRLFALFTLCLERTRTHSVSGAYFQATSVFGDWIVPLRVRIHAGAKLKPSRFSDLAALDNMWSRREGTPTRYAVAGFGFMGFYKHTATSLDFTYARSPVAITMSSTPEIPLEYHPCLMDGAIPLLRIKEGQQEWKKALPLWQEYMGEVRRATVAVRARNIEQGFDHAPLELRKFDLSQFLRKVKKESTTNAG